MAILLLRMNGKKSFPNTLGSLVAKVKVAKYISPQDFSNMEQKHFHNRMTHLVLTREGLIFRVKNRGSVSLKPMDSYDHGNSCQHFY